MDDDDRAPARCLPTRWCGSAGWRSSSSAIAIIYTDLVAPGGWPQLGAIIAIIGVIDAMFAPRLLKKSWDRQDQRRPVKRFWKECPSSRKATAGRSGSTGGRCETPARAPLVVPSEALAEAIAEEWRDGRRDDRSARDAADRPRQCRDRPVAPDRQAFAAGLAKYAEADLALLPCRRPAELVSGRRAAGTSCSSGHGGATTSISRRPPACCTSRSRRPRSSGWRRRSRRSIRSTSPACRRW